MIRVPIHTLIPTSPIPLKSGYGKKAMDEIESLRIPNHINRPEVTGITIDKAESPDLDDGVWAVKKSNGNYVVQVSISDISDIIEPNSHLERAALGKATSIYFNTHILHMFPELIATNIASLNHRQKRLALTCEIEYDRDFNIMRSDFYESVFFNAMRFDHSSFAREFLSTGGEFHEQLHLLHEVAVGINKKFGSIDTTFDESDRHIHLGTPSIIQNQKHVISFIISQLMRSANIEAAILAEREKINGIFRIHMPEMKGSDIIPKEIANAQYAAKTGYHYALKIDTYAHFTSPIRRFADFILHRQIKWWLHHKEGFYQKEDIEELCIYINSQIQTLLTAQKIEQEEINSKRFLRKVKKKNGENGIKKDDITHLLKIFINKGAAIPQIVKEETISIIQKEPRIDDLIFILILKSGDNNLIDALIEKVMYDRKTKRYINILLHQGLINEYQETKQENKSKLGFLKDKIYSLVNEIILKSKKKSVPSPVSIDFFFTLLNNKKYVVKLKKGGTIEGITDEEFSTIKDKYEKLYQGHSHTHFHLYDPFTIRKIILLKILDSFKIPSTPGDS